MFPRLLVCEGFEDAWFFNKLIEARGIQRFYIAHAGGNTKFASAIAKFQLQNTAAFRALRDIVVVADNDDDPKGRFDNACSELKKAFKDNAMVPTAERTPTQKQPRCSILMLPWTNEHGHLESLCVEAAKSTSAPMASHVSAFLALAGADNWPSQSRHGKAWLRSSLAVRCEVDPFVPLGKVFSETRHANLIPVTI